MFKVRSTTRAQHTHILYDKLFEVSILECVLYRDQIFTAAAAAHIMFDFAI